MSDIIVGALFMVSSALPSLCVLVWRRLRNLDALESAERGRRIAVRMACTATDAATASQAQLTACRAVLAAVMREREECEQMCSRLAGKLLDLEQQRQHDRLMARTWLTRTIIDRKVSEN